MELSQICGSDVNNFNHANPNSVSKINQAFKAGMTYSSQGHWTKAARSFHLTRHLTNGDNTATCYHVGSIFNARGAQEALRVLDAASTSLPTAPPPSTAAAPTTTTATTSTTTTIASNQVGTFVLRGKLLTSLSKNIEAIEAYNNVLAVRPHHILAQIGLSKILLSLTNDGQNHLVAKNILLNIIKNDPNHSDGHRLLGHYFDQQRDYESAEVHYEKCVKLDPTNYLSHYNYGKCLSNHADLLSKFDGTSDTTKAERTRSKSVSHLQQATWLLKEAGEMSNANGVGSQIYLLLGQSLLKQQRFDESIGAFRTSLFLATENDSSNKSSSASSSCNPMHHLCVTLASVGQTSEAHAMANQMSIQCGQKAYQKLQNELKQVIPIKTKKKVKKGATTSSGTPVVAPGKKKNRTAELKAEEEKLLVLSSAPFKPTVTVTMGGSGDSAHTITSPTSFMVASGGIVSEEGASGTATPKKGVPLTPVDCDVNYNHDEKEREIAFYASLDMLRQAMVEGNMNKNLSSLSIILDQPRSNTGTLSFL
jgi:tetratricopeptide (TPR) repeat protein